MNNGTITDPGHSHTITDTVDYVPATEAAEGMKKGFQAGIELALKNLKLVLDSGVVTDNLSRVQADVTLGMTKAGIIMDLIALTRTTQEPQATSGAAE